MSLIAWQRSFRAEIAASDEDGPPSSTGMAIYRDAYRGRLAAALASSFERTRRWVEAEPFDLAAAHYILTRPPADWTLDNYGTDFPALLSELFAENPEAGELAWFEWHLQQAFAARDLPALGATELAAAALGPEDWDALRFAPAAGFASRRIATGCVALWQALGSDNGAADCPAPPEQRWLVVWRQNDQPHFRLLGDDEYALLEALVGGTALGSALSRLGGQSEAQLGGWLAQWLGEGLFAAFTVNTTATREKPVESTPNPACPEPVEGPFFLRAATHKPRRKGQCFDKLSTDGFDSDE